MNNRKTQTKTLAIPPGSPVGRAPRRLKRIVALLIFLLLWLSQALAYAQDLSLDDVLRIALEQNAQVKNAAIDRQATDDKIREIRGALLPSVTMNHQYQYYLNLPAQYAPASNFGGPEGQYKRMTMSMPQTISSNVQLSQALFNQSVFTGLKAAKTEQVAWQQREQLTKEGIVYQVSATYYAIQVQDENLERLAGNIANLEQTAKINASLKDNGIVAENTHNRILVNLENLRNQYVSQRLEVQNNRNLLKYLMGMSLSDTLALAPFDNSEGMFAPETGAIERRNDIKLQETQLALSEYDRKITQAAYMPTLVAGVTTGYTSYYSEFSPTKQINNDWIRNTAVTLGVRVPLFSGFQRKHQVRQKDAAIRKNVNTLSMMKLDARREQQDAYNNYLSSRQQLANSKRTLELAEKLFGTTHGEYANGLSSVTELLNAQTDLSTARTNYSMVQLNLKLAELALKKANGELIQSN